VCVHDGTSAEVGVVEVNNTAVFRCRHVQEVLLIGYITAPRTQIRSTTNQLDSHIITIV